MSPSLEVTRSEFGKLLADIEKHKLNRAEKMPNEKAALKQMSEAFTRLKELGWQEAIYCPKDGSIFKAIEAGSTGIQESCHYSGEWPTGRWWVSDAGDLWPSRPILFKPNSGRPDVPPKPPVKPVA